MRRNTEASSIDAWPCDVKVRRT